MKNCKKTLPAFIILGSLFVAFGVVHAKSSQNASIILQRQTQGLFELTIRDPDGIQSFSIQPEKKSSYGGEVKCPKTYSSKNVVFSFEDFTPPMKAFVIDCAGNQTDFEISEPDSKGVARAKVIVPAAAPEPAPSSSQAPAAPQETSSASAPAKEKSLVDISYPVKELGNCGDQESCISYCDDEAHINECLAFAKKHNLLSEDEVRKADKFAELGGKGPGGCSSRKSCETYCSDISHMDECLDWGEKNGFISDKELAEAKKIQTAIKGGAKLPGGCKNKQGCEEYCTNPNNIDECIQFAESSGILPPEELAEAKKVSEFIKRGETPGGCRSKDQCERYCSAENNLEECIAFAEKTGLASKEELELFKKTGGKGPGGCKGKVQCEAFCNSPEHQEECFSWAREHDLLKEEDLERMREGASRFKEEFEKMPPEVVECLKATVGEEILDKMIAGEPVFAKDMGEKMQKCFAEAFESFGGEFGSSGGGPGGPGSGPGGPGGGPSGGFSGPGGCSNPEECFKFCSEHQEECEGFGPPGGGPGDRGGDPGGGFQGGPGGCTSIEECTAYCIDHPEECQEFGHSNGGTGGFPGGVSGGGGQSGQGISPGFAKCLIDELGEQKFQDYLSGVRNPDYDEVADYCKNPPPPEVDAAAILRECVVSRLGEEIMDKWVAGIRSEQILRVFKFCGTLSGWDEPEFDHITPGCNNRIECQAYCEQTPQNCVERKGGSGPACGTGEIWNGVECRSYPKGSNPEKATQCTNQGGRWDGSKCEFSAGNSSGGGNGGYSGSGGGGVAQSCVSVPSGLIGWWKAEGGATDSADGNNGSVSGAVAFVPGKVGNAFKFDKGSVNVSNPPSLNFGTRPFSLEAWFNWDGRGEPAVNNIIRKSNYGPGPGSGYWLRVGAGKVEFSVGATTQSDGQTLITAPVSSGVWYHAVAVKDSSGNVKLYIDGQSAGTIIRQAENTNSTSEDPFVIGAWRGTTEFFHGLIDEVSVYNRALDASEVRAIFSAGSAGKCSAASSSGSSAQPPAGGGVPPTSICPALPTVNSCPAGQRKEVAFSSTECGTYYICVPEFSSPPQIVPEGFIPPFSSVEDPAARCKETGGAWDGQTCVHSAPPSSFNVQLKAASSLDAFLGTLGF